MDKEIVNQQNEESKLSVSIKIFITCSVFDLTGLFVCLKAYQ